MVQNVLSQNAWFDLDIMADPGITEEYRCGYCFEEFNSMNDPRKLPCGHTFCLPCLQGNYNQGEGVHCPTCQ